MRKGSTFRRIRASSASGSTRTSRRRRGSSGCAIRRCSSTRTGCRSPTLARANGSPSRWRSTSSARVPRNRPDTSPPIRDRTFPSLIRHTMSRSISRYPIPALESLPDDIRARIAEVQEKAGFVPNVFVTLAHRPDEFRAFFAYHDALMLRESGLTKAEREMIVVATSGANDCPYCVVAHGAILRVYAKNPLVADQVAINYRKADITERQQAMLEFALKVALRSAE